MAIILYFKKKHLITVNLNEVKSSLLPKLFFKVQENQQSTHLNRNYVVIFSNPHIFQFLNKD